jgi:hypothetical protein
VDGVLGVCHTSKGSRVHSGRIQSAQFGTPSK